MHALVEHLLGAGLGRPDTNGGGHRLVPAPLAPRHVIDAGGVDPPISAVVMLRRTRVLVGGGDVRGNTVAAGRTRAGASHQVAHDHTGHHPPSVHTPPGARDPEKASNPNPDEGSGLADVSRHHNVGELEPPVPP